MTPLAAALLGVVGGFVLGAVLVWWTGRDRSGHGEAAALARSRLQAVVDHLHAVVLVVEPGGWVAVSSRMARTSGLVRSTRLASDQVADEVAAVAQSGVPATTQVELGQLGGRSSRVELTLTPLPQGAVLITGEDRSADRRFVEARRDFVANITHELKTPIGAILLLSEALDATADDPDAIRGFVTRLTAETERLNQLVSDILALSRLQAEDPLLVAEPVDVDEVVEASLQRCRAQAVAREVALSSGARSGLTVLGDAQQLETAVTNLVQNAVTYSEAGARVVVTASGGEGDTVELKVSDTGIGISEADLARVFERFYRVDPGRSRDNGGTGLGLSIVKHIATAHGGEVAAWSRLGQGSTFTIRIPRYGQEGDN